ncbi:uncharacterized protein LOC127131293 [Lathyrus oleraceus]|uniref:uncharacterized protein LOC127131293 n=1 Tax=Pisum sativum TaxID=3888 RepID=UPI0021D127A9|nr:uncharacterized protein LOC127131293 [Pisum sativum]
MVAPPPSITQTNDRDHYNAKPIVFYGDRFDYWKVRIKSFFLGHYVDLWDMVTNYYIHPIDESGNKVERRVRIDQQKKDYKNHHKARTILLNVISYTEYEKITNKDIAKSIFDSLRMTHEGNAQVKETKALALIQKHEAFKMEDEETVEDIFSRFQTLVIGLKVLDKGHEIELEVDETNRKSKSFALKSSGRSEKTKALQAETDEESEEESEEENELSLLSIRVNQLYKKRKGKFKGLRRIETIQSESESDYEEVFSELSCSELEFSLSEVLEKYQNLLNKYKDLKKISVSESKAYCSGDVIKKYKSFQKFLAKSLNKSLMASKIYGVSKNRTRGIGYDSDDEYDSEKDGKPNTLKSHFVPSGKQNDVRPKHRTISKLKAKTKTHAPSNHAFMYKYPTQKPKVIKNSGKANPKDPERYGYLSIRYSKLWISLAAKLRHQPWYLDFGCSRHMTGRRHMFQILELKPEGIVVFISDQKGKIIGSRIVDNNSLPFITNFILVEGLMHNILSISQLCDNGYDTIFNQKSCKAVSEKDGLVLFNGKSKNNIYKIILSNLKN